MRSFTALSALILVGVAGCGEESVAPCQADTECSSGELCVAGTCGPPTRFECVPGSSEAATLELSNYALDFGVSSASVERELVIASTGDCSLELYAARLEDGRAFRCEGCETSAYPRRIAPNRSFALKLRWDGAGAEVARDTLILMSNAAGQAELRIPLSGAAAGMPAPRVTPAELDFGFVPTGEEKTLLVQVVNDGDGSAALNVLAHRVEPEGTAFSSVGQRPLPYALPPAAQNPDARLPIEVSLNPSAPSEHAAELVIETSAGVLRVPLSGAERPPVFGLETSVLDFGAVRLGQTKVQLLTLQNSGPSPLELASQVGPSIPDLTLEGVLNGELPPGAVRPVRILYTPTRAGALQAQLRIRTNDPERREAMVELRGTTAAETVSLVSVDMSYEADSDSALDVDIRKVRLLLENPDGQVCRLANPTTNWVDLGQCQWIRRGDQSERVVLSDVTRDARFAVMLTYEEDCATLPTALAAGFLGIGADELIKALSEDAVDIPAEQLSSAIEEVCVDRRSIEVTLKTRIDGQDVETRQVRLANKGELKTGLTLVRGASGFTLE